ncbi:hypothetical protein FJR38_21065 [Anabaena sp. UHCC 0253]|nr:hypothetical protein [Anabaena sp. UHCC 0204]MTJ54978.1 hypothetical protein [Anabaena sp. UHCC 0253]
MKELIIGNTIAICTLCKIQSANRKVCRDAGSAPSIVCLLAKKYQIVNHELNYALDDYVILARR